MPRATVFVALGCMLTVAACTATPPSAPTVLALPPAGKSLPQFQQEDADCRGYAQQQISQGASQQEADESAMGNVAASAAAGGAATSAAAHATGTGTAAGGVGMLSGSAVTSNSEAASAGVPQLRYDIAYAQCMAANGNQVQQVVLALPYAPYAYPYPSVYDPWFGPWTGFGFFSFSGHRHHHIHHAFIHHSFHRG